MAMLGDEKYNRAQRAKTVGFTDAAISDYNATNAANTAAVQDRNSKIGRTGMFGYNTAMDIKGLTPVKDAVKSGYDALTGAKGAADAANTANAASNASSAANTVEALRTGGEVASNIGAATTGAGAAGAGAGAAGAGAAGAGAAGAAGAGAAGAAGAGAGAAAAATTASTGVTGALAAMGPVGWISAALLAADLF
jgi:hypothetical protein